MLGCILQLAGQQPTVRTQVLSVCWDPVGERHALAQPPGVHPWWEDLSAYTLKRSRRAEYPRQQHRVSPMAWRKHRKNPALGRQWLFLGINVATSGVN